jgi:small GTP-binding protein
MSEADDARFEQEMPIRTKQPQKGGRGLGILVLLALFLVSVTAILIGYFVSTSLAVYIGVPLLCLGLVMAILAYAYQSAATPVVIVSNNVEPPLSCAALTPEKKPLEILLVGNAHVGKTKLIERYTLGSYDETSSFTAGIDFAFKQVKEEKLYVWDTAGQLAFRSLIQPYFQRANAVLIAYAITDRATFHAVPAWIKKVRQQAPRIPLTLVGCQRDRVDQRQVSYQEAYQFSEQQGLLFFETSAKSGFGVQEAFETGLPSLRHSRRRHSVAGEEGARENSESVASSKHSV